MFSNVVETGRFLDYVNIAILLLKPRNSVFSKSGKGLNSFQKMKQKTEGKRHKTVLRLYIRNPHFKLERREINNNNNNNNNKYLMITPLKELFSIILKSLSPLSQLRIPTGRRQTSWLFKKRGAFAPSITEHKSIQ